MRLTFLDPGKLTARLDLERADETADGQGGVIVTWSAVTTLWGLVEPVSVRAGEEANASLSTLSHRVTTRFRDDVESGMRFSFRNRMLLIRAVRDPDETRRYLVCQCEEMGR